MKSAEKLAEEIHHIFFGGSCHSKEPCDDIAHIAKALTAYAEERVREAYDDGFKDGKQGRDIIDDCVKNAVAEAFEEAAKVAQNFKWSTDNDSEVTEILAHKIRALKVEAGK